MIKCLRQISPDEFEKQICLISKFKKEISQIWEDQGLTAVVSPLFPHCAPLNSHSAATGLMLEYSVMHNLTGFPVGVMPITDVAENEQTFSDNYNDKWTKLM